MQNSCDISTFITSSWNNNYITIVTRKINIGIHKNKRATSVLEDVASIPEIQYTNIFMFGTAPMPVPGIAWPEKVEDNQDIIRTV